MTIDDLTVGLPTCDDDTAILGRGLERILAEPVTARPIVVDMSSAPGVRDLVTSFGDAIRYEPYQASCGVSDSRNRIVTLTDTRYLLMLDADAIPEPGWATHMRRAFDRDAQPAVVGGRCLPEWSDRRPPLFGAAPALDFLGMFDLGDTPIPVPRIMGTTYAIDRERLPGDPPFPTELGRRAGQLLAYEEVAYCLGVLEKGWSIHYEPSAVVRHHVRKGRASWTWMQRRAFVAGQESRLSRTRLEPLPRPTTWRDRAFLAAIAPMYLAGRLRGPGKTTRWRRTDEGDR